MRIYTLIILATLCNCADTKKENTSDDKRTVKLVDINSDTSNSLTQEEPMKKLAPITLRTLQEFERTGNDRPVEINDSLFIDFLVAFTTYQNLSNDQLYANPDFETLNTLAYSPDDIIAPEAIKFQDSVKEIGFIVAMTEGSIYLEKDSAFLSKFSPYLSDRMSSFIRQYNLENNEPMSEDGGLVLSTNEHIHRMIFWDEFARVNPDFELPDYADGQFKMYLYYLMFGMDNTPIHGWNDSLVISQELIQAFEMVIDKYPDSKASDYLDDYLLYIKAKEFKYDESFDVYARENFPEWFAN